MSENRAPDEFIAKRRMRLRVALITAILAAPVICKRGQRAGERDGQSDTHHWRNLAAGHYQSGSTVSPTGIPLALLRSHPRSQSSPPRNGHGSMSGSGASCSTLGDFASGMYGSTATYDGGGMAMGTAAPATAATSGCRRHRDVGDVGNVETSGMSGMAARAHAASHLRRLPRRRHRPRFGGAARNRDSAGVSEIGKLGSVPPQQYRR